ncbi:hypothetical protein BASA81_011201 [Batrachochytrium salamandrivorans]|nr:hypothetical protein BASA81_011201 [Batrachochytrium salamandrivorans]
MKLAAATIFSLVAIVTYAPPAAYAENRVGMHYNEIDTPVMTHLEKRAGDQQDPPETTEDTQESVDFGHHQPVYKGLKGYKRYRKQQQHRVSRIKLHDPQCQEEDQPSDLESPQHCYDSLDYPRYRPHDNGPDSVLASKEEFDQPDTTNKETHSRLDSDSGITEEKAPHEEPETGAPVYTHDPYESVVEDAGAEPSRLPKGILRKYRLGLNYGPRVRFSSVVDENYPKGLTDSEDEDYEGEQVENKDFKDDNSEGDDFGDDNSEDDDSEDDDSKSKGSSHSKIFAKIKRPSFKRLREQFKNALSDSQDSFHNEDQTKASIFGSNGLGIDLKVRPLQVSSVISQGTKTSP